MRLNYKIIILTSILFLFCVGSVCATNTDNTTHTKDNYLDDGLNPDYNNPLKHLKHEKINETVTVDYYIYVDSSEPTDSFEVTYNYTDWNSSKMEEHYDKKFINLMKGKKAIDKTNAKDINQWFVIGLLKGDVALYNLAYTKDNDITMEARMKTLAANGALVAGSCLLLHGTLKTISTVENNLARYKIGEEQTKLSKSIKFIQGKTWDEFVAISNEYNNPKFNIKSQNYDPQEIKNMIYLGQEQVKYYDKLNIYSPAKEKYMKTIDYLTERLKIGEDFKCNNKFVGNLKDLKDRYEINDKAEETLRKNEMRVTEDFIDRAGITIILTVVAGVLQLIHEKVFFNNFDPQGATVTDLEQYADYRNTIGHQNYNEC